MSAARDRDICTGHPSGPGPRPNRTHASRTFAEGRPAMRKGDLWVPHGSEPAPSPSVRGAPRVLVEGRRMVRKRDRIACGTRVLTGSSVVVVA